MCIIITSFVERSPESLPWLQHACGLSPFLWQQLLEPWHMWLPMLSLPLSTTINNQRQKSPHRRAADAL
jgi:hypothetical protein